MPTASWRKLWLAIASLMFVTNMYASTDSEAAVKVPIRDGWMVQSSCKVAEKGDVISTAAYKPSGWVSTTVPATVIAAQLAAKTDKVFVDPFFGRNLRNIPGTSYPEKRVFSQLPIPDDSPYKCSWWYRTEFEASPDYKNRNVWMNFGGINYRANIWINGKQIANSTDVAGAYRTYEFNVTDAIDLAKPNVVAVEVFAAEAKDLGINWVDWAPSPADKNMGLWRGVWLTDSGPVALRKPQVLSKVDTSTLKSAELTISAEVQNNTDKPVQATLKGLLEAVALEQSVELAPHETKTVTFSPDKFPQLKLQDPRLWWPWQMGPQNLYTLNLNVDVNRHISDQQRVKFGIREVKSEFTAHGGRLFSVNGKKILIRGGGWSPDLFMREDPARLLKDFRYVKHLGLNTIRLEGKMETDEFYDLADREGILIMAGWCCCDTWERWNDWTGEHKKIAVESLRSQLLRMRNHPSVFAWLNGSDNPPVPEIEQAYLDVEKELNWPNPVVSSATQKPTTVTGPSGVKMTGPYDWVPPEYWFVARQDLRAKLMFGGAWGFNTETGPGPAIPPTAMLKRFIPEDQLWPVNDMWNFHAGLEGFPNIDIFRNAMNARYGEPKTLDEFQAKAQAMTYEGERAMFEAYSRNKYDSTGVIQWMLNNPWPSIIWHLYDYYFMPAGGYFGTKKANEPVHILYGYDDHAAWVVNSTYAPVKGLKATVIVLDFDLKPKFSKVANVEVPEDGTVKVIDIPELSELGTTYFVKLQLHNAAGKLVSDNFYWLSTKKDVYDWDKTDYKHTPIVEHADLSAMNNLPKATVTYSSRSERRGTEETTHVTLKNTSKALAFQVHLRVLKGEGGEDVLPVLWNDNYVTLMPGESRELSATYAASQLGTARPAVVVEGWNVVEKKAAPIKTAEKH